MRTSVIVDPTLLATSPLAYICKEHVSQYGHIHKYQELGYQHNFWGRYKSIYKL